ncbi:ATP-binding protein [Enterovibrio calviensis]|uniref:ATP-binding protein n=1 Tax=Enterovibrio calviensis TaxID=91359 RepID=UPI00048465D8|nr:ATP-binding protein [Enterovibrio calviensis]
MSLFIRLWLSFLVTLGMVLVLLYGAVQWSFDNGMIRYINEREAATYTTLTHNLASFHQWKGDFSQLRNEPFYWRKLVLLSQRTEAFTQLQFSEWEVEALFEQPKRHRLPPKRPPPEGRRGHLPPPDHHAPAPRIGDAPPHKRGLKGRTNDVRVSLLSDALTPLIGPYKEDFDTLPIKIDDTVVGYIAWPPSKVPEASYDIAFAESQRHAFLLLASIALVLGAVAAFFFSRIFTSPINRIAATTKRLVKGEYQTRTDVKGTDEIGQLAIDINTLATTLDANEKARREWLANTAHELRTPLSIIKGEFEAIIDGVRPADKNTLASIEEEVAHLQTLIEDLYTLSNADIGAFRYDMKLCNLDDLVTNTVERYRAIAADKRISISVLLSVSPTYIKGDETRLHQLLENLLKNSEKYTDAPGEIIVTLAREASNVILTIDDTAPSVPDEALPRLFEKLYRVETSRNRRTGGAGLGLAIVKKIVEAHNGTIIAKHSDKGGLRVTVALEVASTSGRADLPSSHGEV